MPSNIQTISFHQPGNEKAAPAARHTGILQDQLRRAQKRPWNPSFSLAVRILLLVRFTAAMYSNIDDCDEVFNFWEPLHFIDKGNGFQTWEVSPKYAIRSWAYILLHSMTPQLSAMVFGMNKRIAFFSVRACLAVASTVVEATFFRAVVEKINERAGRYVFFMLLFSAGMWNASTAFLPSSFAMYTTTLASSFALAPSSLGNSRRTFFTTAMFATGAIVGWPFALALSIPFVFEELFIFGADRVPSDIWRSWATKRWLRLMKAGALSFLLFIPLAGIDSLAYGRFVVVPWNIIKYNIAGGSERGPNLYGTAPWNYYIKNLLLNFNFMLPLSLLSLPALAVTYVIDRKRLGFYKPADHQTSPFTLVALRLAPFYLWFGILTLQPHKEERFMFPAYPLLCMNAAITIYFARGWLEVAFIKITKSPYRASQSLIFRNFTFSILVGFIVISISRVFALWNYYHSPMTIAHIFQNDELPRLLNVSGLLPVYPVGTREDDIPQIDLTPIKHFNLTLCFGKEWHRFPGHYLVPDAVTVDFIQSEFNGLLPGKFIQQAQPVVQRDFFEKWFKPQTQQVPENQNDLNKAEPSHYVSVDRCDYLVDLDFPHHPTSSALEPRYAIDEDWERVACLPFLDARHSNQVTRMFWLPGEMWRSMNEFGDYCLLKNKARVLAKEKEVVRRLWNEEL